MSIRSQAIPVVFEDNHLLVVVKPANMPAQADASGDPDVLSTMRAYIAQKYQKPGAVYLGLVHRLDRPVGGLMVFARTSKAADRLCAQARDKSLSRQYVAVVRGETPERGDLTDWLLKDERTNTARVVTPETPGAKDAHLRYVRIACAGELALLRIRLFTGRPHQIRVQLAHAGMPIWGDARYGGGKPGEQIALWGMHLGFIHPTKKEPMDFTAPPPAFLSPWNRFDEAVWTREGTTAL